jgi:hypothetical protein
MYFTTRAFLKDLVERTVSTFAQTAAGLLVADAFTPLDVGSWQNVALASGVAALVAALKALGRSNDGSPSLREAITERGEFE